MLQILSGADLPGIKFSLGDKDKGMKAVYEVVVGEGIGAGRESEPLLLLGSDMTARAKAVQQYLGHALEAFKDVTNYVDVA